MIHLVRSAERFVSEHNGIHSLMSYSAGPYFDPQRMGFGRLIGHDEHLLDPAAGFSAHRHRDVDIVSVVVDGDLLHEDGFSPGTIVRSGQLHLQRTGLGIEHSERNASDVTPVRFFQLLLQPVNPPGEPSYQLLDTEDRLDLGDGAELQIVRLESGAFLKLAPDALTHVHVVRGEVKLRGCALTAGDSAEVSDAEPPGLVAVSSAVVLALTGL